MALQMTVTTPHGFSAVNAYHRVENVSIPQKNRLQFMLVSYKNASTPMSFESELYHCDHDLNGDNAVAQAYAYLKTLGQFNGAMDV